MRTFQGTQYWNCDDLTEEEMEAIHNMDDKSKEIRHRLFERKGWNTLPAGLFRRDSE